MKKVLLLSSISYLLLVSCGTSVSLTENYFEDENYYNPELPIPTYALKKEAPSNGYSESDYDAIWQGTTSNGYAFPNTPTYGRQNYWTNGFGRIHAPLWTINSMGSWSTFGWNNNAMGMSPWSAMWMNPYAYDPYGYDPYSYNYGYNTYGYNPYGFNGWGWNNGWSSTGGTNGSNATATPPRPGINYGGSRPNKYTRSSGGSSTNGRVEKPKDQSIGARTLRAIEQFSEPTNNVNARSSTPVQRTRPTERSYTPSTTTRSYEGTQDRSWSRPTETSRSVNSNAGQNYSPSSSGRSSSTSSGAGGSRRR